MLEDVLAFVECSIEAEHDAGDHTIVVGRDSHQRVRNKRRPCCILEAHTVLRLVLRYRGGRRAIGEKVRAKDLGGELMKLQSRVCEILQIEQPIVLAGMGGAAARWRRQCLTPVVWEYGSSSLRPRQLRQWIRQTREMTDKPFGVDTCYPLRCVGPTTKTVMVQRHVICCQSAKPLRKNLCAKKVWNRLQVNHLGRKKMGHRCLRRRFLKRRWK